MKKRVNDKICQDCGKPYKGSKYSKLCDACRKYHSEHRMNLSGDSVTGTSVRGKPIGMTLKQIAWYSNRLHERQPGKMPKYESCPNFDKTSVTCASCPEGVWKFKDCGRFHQDPTDGDD